MEPLALELVPPVGKGWTAVVEMSVRLEDGGRSVWVTEVPTPGFTSWTPTLPSDMAVATGSLTLLVAQVSFVSDLGEITPALGLPGVFAESGASGLASTPRTWKGGRIATTPPTDPHESVEIDTEVAP